MQIKNSSSSNQVTIKPFEETYKSLVSLKEDLYYKDIINAHKDTLIRKTQERINDIFHCYKSRYISKNEMFTQLEELRVKNHIIDPVVYDNINLARKTFCKPKVSNGTPGRK